MPTPNISKSKYIKYCQCAKALWLMVNNPDAAEEDSQAKERLAAGQEVGALARGLFGEYTNVTTLKGDGVIGNLKCSKFGNKSTVFQEDKYLSLW